MPQLEAAIIDCRVLADRIRPEGQEITIVPQADVLARLAARLDLPAIHSLKARYRLSRRGRRIRAEGTFEARVVRTCVVTLEDFETDVTDTIEAVFEEAPDLRRHTAGRIEVEVALEAEDPPEPIEDGRIDLGRLTEEFLTLALDPHPRKPGAAFAEVEPAPEQDKPSPFAGLAERLNRNKSRD